ncbi:MAG: Gx transporter family protein [Christensenellales bacterium]|nr:Gx transporter family protein [Clostridiales bacterium]
MNNKNIKIKKLSITSIFLTLALILGVIENLIPPIIPFLPFIKIGLSNLILIFIIVVFSWKESLIISLLKSIIVPLMIGNPIMIIYSLPASLISTISNATLINLKKLSLVIISVLGAIVHNLIQLIVASFVLSSISVFALMPYLLLLAIISGLSIGLISFFLIKKIPQTLVVFYD